jgi:uncharacterized protein YfeS
MPGSGFDFAVTVTRFAVFPGETEATEPVTLVLREAFVDEKLGRGYERLELQLHFRHEGRPPRPFNAADVARYHRYVDEFPKVTVRTKAKRIEIRWALDLSLKPFLPGREPTVEQFQELSAEVVRALVTTRPRLAKVRDFDVAALLARVEAALAGIRREPKAFLANLERLKARSVERAARLVAADPWAALDIDWTQYHANARKMLDDPLFWDPTDESSPTGNDTGADVLESYRAWRRRRKSVADAITYLEKLLADWGTRDELVRDEAFIALAFAQVMLDGTTADDVACCALAAIDRQLERTAAWPQPAVRRTALEKLRKATVRAARQRGTR